MTRRWPRTGSACRPATRCRNAGSPRCSDAHPAAGREPESPMHDRNRRSQTRRASRSRLTRKQGPPAVSPDAIVTAPGRSGIGAWRSARCALWVNLDAMSVKAWPGWASPAGTTRPRSGSSARPWVLMWPSMLGTPWNWRPGTATGSSYSAPPPLLRVLPHHGARIVPLLEVDDLDQASAELARGGAELLGGRSQTAPGPGSPSGCPTGTSTAWAPAWRSWQVRRLWSNALDMRSDE